VLGFDDALAITLIAEGGYVDDPDDRGGATNFGVTQRTYDQFRRRHSMPLRPVREITEDEVYQVYQDYWTAVGADTLQWPLSAVMFDMAVNHGPSSAKKLLQRTLEVREDGIVGPKTRFALGAFDTDSLTNHLLWTRVDRYRALARGNQAKFLSGWLWRVAHLREHVGLAGLDSITPAPYTE
jgi:lysozyme family protein